MSYRKIIEKSENMRTDRLAKVLNELEQRRLEQMLITDPYSIFYLTGRMLDPGERFFALYISRNGENAMVINELFTVPEDLGVEKIWYADTEDGVAKIVKLIDHGKTLGVDKDLCAKFLLHMMELKAAKAYVNASICVDIVRALKDKEEIEAMREASRINDIAMNRFRDCIKEGITERMLAEQFESIYRDLGAEGNAFAPLVGFGKNAAVGHYAPKDEWLRPGDCVLLDVGCRKNYYCSDMTRTFFYDHVSKREEQIYEIVKKAQQQAENMIAPGIPLCDIDKAARQVIEDAGYGKNFTHRLGHFIGTQVHEYGDVSSTAKGVAKEGMIFSIEPGIYLLGELGIRIEDLVLVTKTGVEVLNHFSKELQIVY